MLPFFPLVGSRCDGRTHCRIRANNREFGKDPCPNTMKYLEVGYYCEPGINVYHFFIKKHWLVFYCTKYRRTYCRRRNVSSWKLLWFWLFKLFCGKKFSRYDCRESVSREVRNFRWEKYWRNNYHQNCDIFSWWMFLLIQYVVTQDMSVSYLGHQCVHLSHWVSMSSIT